MADIRKALDYVLGWEGGLSDHPADHGGLTNLGITQVALDAARKARPKAGYPKDVADLSTEQAVDIYTRDYAPKGWDGILDQAVATVYLDQAVNSGPGRATTLLQRALCATGNPVTVDGSFGPKTLAAVNASDPSQLLAVYRQQRVSFYTHLVDSDPSQAVFLRGWLRRANSVPLEA